MSAERHALDAALSYSAKLEKQIEHMTKTNYRLNGELRDMRRKIRDVGDAIQERDRPSCHSPMGPMEGSDCEEKASMPQEAMCEASPPNDCPRCKNCGCPV